MAEWSKLADDMKMCVTIYKEIEAGRPIWFTRLAKLLEDDMSRIKVSYLEDKLMDLGILDKQWIAVKTKRKRRWWWPKTVRLNTYCYRVCKCPEDFIKNVAENVTRN